MERLAVRVGEAMLDLYIRAGGRATVDNFGTDIRVVCGVTCEFKLSVRRCGEYWRVDLEHLEQVIRSPFGRLWVRANYRKR